MLLMADLNPRHRTAGPLSAVAFVLGLGFLVVLQPATAFAQSDLQSLSSQVQRLQRELNTLQRAVYRGEVPQASGESGAIAADTPAAARLSLRMNDLEQQIRNLTGQVEEIDFRVRQISDRVDKLVADVDYRLRRLEGGGTASQPAETGQDGGPQGGTSESRRQSGDTGTPRVLGKISQSDVEAIRQGEGTGGAADGQVGAGGSDTGGGQATQTARSRPAGDVLPEGSPEKKYDYAFGLLKQFDYPAARQAFQAFMSEHPDHPRASNAAYWLGETYYAQEDYETAAVRFAEGYRSYPDGAKAPDTLLKLGMSLAKVGKTREACELLREVENRYKDFREPVEHVLQTAERQRSELGC